MHLFRLLPSHDPLQTDLREEISVSAEGLARDYEDVFGNRVMRRLVEKPFGSIAIGPPRASSCSTATR